MSVFIEASRDAQAQEKLAQELCSGRGDLVVFARRAALTLRPFVSQKSRRLETVQDGIDGAFDHQQVGIAERGKDVVGVGRTARHHEQDGELEGTLAQLGRGVPDIDRRKFRHSGLKEHNTNYFVLQSS